MREANLLGFILIRIGIGRVDIIVRRGQGTLKICSWDVAKSVLLVDAIHRCTEANQIGID